MTVRIDCPTCQGRGEIEFNPSPRREPWLEDSARCPECLGDCFIEVRDELAVRRRLGEWLDAA